MKLVAGLGNPKKKYEKTRHNVGFRVIDSLDFAQDKDVILLKPNTFMNNSGKAVQKCLAYYKIPTSNLIVVHDDIDLLFGDIRVSKNSSSAGHKGVQSIIDELKTKDFTRIRIGIKPLLRQACLPARQGYGGQAQKEIDTTEFVLKKFTKQEEKKLEKIIPEAVKIIKKELRPVG